MKQPDLLQQLIDKLPVFGRVLDVLSQAGLTTWLVGGCVRDLLLNRPLGDIDLVSFEDPTEAAKAIARKIGGHWFWLDRSRKQSRIVAKEGIQIDFAQLRADTIEGDLLLRDFTINAMAVGIVPREYAGDCIDSELIDPLRGQGDLHARTLRMCATRSFRDDPLRMLKGIRHAVTLAFDLEPKTLQTITEQAQSVTQVAGERIRDELLQIFDSRNYSTAVQLLADSGLLKAILGRSNRPLDMVALRETMAATDHCLNAVIHDHTERPVFNELVLVPALFQLAVLLRHYIVDDVASSLRFLRLSRRQQALVTALMRPLTAEDLNYVQQAEQQRGRALVIELLHPFGRERLLYWGLCEGSLTLDQIEKLFTAYAALQQRGRIPDLLSGREFPPVAPARIGGLQRQIKQAEIKGLISTKEQAREWLNQQLSFDKN